MPSICPPLLPLLISSLLLILLPFPRHTPTSPYLGYPACSPGDDLATLAPIVADLDPADHPGGVVWERGVSETAATPLLLHYN